jgi:hypothetical protein
MHCMCYASKAGQCRLLQEAFPHALSVSQRLFPHSTHPSLL